MMFHEYDEGLLMSTLIMLIWRKKRVYFCGNPSFLELYISKNKQSGTRGSNAQSIF